MLTPSGALGARAEVQADHGLQLPSRPPPPLVAPKALGAARSNFLGVESRQLAQSSVPAVLALRLTQLAQAPQEVVPERIYARSVSLVPLAPETQQLAKDRSLRDWSLIARTGPRSPKMPSSGCCKRCIVEGLIVILCMERKGEEKKKKKKKKKKKGKRR
uniref:Uncharacterized protein n=1 Tax=Ananas comosus var. bracteatus TaxID=296719 RepID=A0A6V7PXZ6_ANACO|nr:unnamed protein product [Ananas comosus var. bracteatus]